MRISDWSSDVCSSDLMEKMVHLGKLPPQTMSQFYAVTGDEPGASALFDVGAVSNTMPVVDTVGYHEHPAIAAIVAAARDRRIVLINEDHHSTRQRAFSLLLARALRGAGFNYFGAEIGRASCRERVFQSG